MPHVVAAAGDVIVLVVSAAVSVVVAGLAAFASVRVGNRTAATSDRANLRSAENEQERIGLDALTRSLERLEADVVRLQTDVEECRDREQKNQKEWSDREAKSEAERSELLDELGGMRAANQMLRVRVATLEAHLERILGHPLRWEGDEAELKLEPEPVKPEGDAPK